MIARRLGVTLLAVAVLATTAAAPADAAGIVFGIVPSPNPSTAQGSYLGGDSCSAPDACAAVGHVIDADGFDEALVEGWNGAGWRLPPLHVPAGTVSSDLYKVSCPAATACLAVGRYDLSDGVDRPLAEFWNGSYWAVDLPAFDGNAGRLNAVSCAAATDCEAVGAEAGAQLIAHWDGTSWAIVPGATVNGQSPALEAVSCVAADACVAVGEYAGATGERTLAERWNGRHWLLSKTPNHAGDVANYLDGVTCTAATACVAVGNHDASFGTAKTLIETLTGATWSMAKAPSPANRSYSTLTGVACASASSCLAVGAAVAAGANGRAFAESWDGTRWALEKVALPRRANASYLNGAYCPASGYCTFAGGYSGNTIAHRTLIETALPPS